MRMQERVVTAICVATAIYYIYTAFVGMLSPYMQLVPLLAVSMVLTFIKRPKADRWPGARLMDYLLAFLSIGCTFFIMINEEHTGDLAGDLQTSLVIVGGVFLLVLLEATRRAMGWTLPILSVVFILYALFGNYLPGLLHHAGFSLTRVVDSVSLTQMGVFGVALRVVCDIVLYFLIFGAILQATEGGQFFIDLALSLVGNYRGGPAKVAVISSGLMGMISGSSVANVVTTGTLTIPMMKKTGWEASQAGAVETIASTGGMIMPPVMGATAFIMADVMGVSYWAVCLAAFVPAFIYYIALYLAIDAEAAKKGLIGLPKNQLPSLRVALSWGWVFIVVVGVMTFWLSVVHGSARISALYATIALLLLSLINKRTRPTPKKIYHALADSIKSSVVVVIACACVGIIVGTVSMTSMGLVLSESLIEFSQGIIPLLVLFVAIIATIFGMGMPPPPIYIFLSLTVVPAMIALKVNAMAAHMFVFWYGVLSNITPPVGICFYAAAPIAQAPPLKVGMAATKLGLIVFLLPFIFIFRPALLLEGTMLDVIIAISIATLIACCLCAMLQGYFYGKLSVSTRALFGVAGFTMAYAGSITMVIGFVVLAIAIAITLLQRRTHNTVSP